MFVSVECFEKKTFYHYSVILRPDNHNWWCRINLRNTHYLLCTQTSVFENINSTIASR